MIFELHPPRAAGPLRIGATGHDTVEILGSSAPRRSSAGLRGAGLPGPFTAHRARSSSPTSTLTTTWKPSSSDGRTAGRTAPSPTTGLTCSPRQRQTSSPSCDSAPPSTRKKTAGTPSPHPAFFCPCGGRSLRMLIAGPRHLRAVLDEYVAHYNRHRPHRARNLRPLDCDDITMATTTDLTAARIRRRKVLGGLIHEYERAA
jgi:hypothetical protein